MHFNTNPTVYHQFTSTLNNNSMLYVMELIKFVIPKIALIKKLHRKYVLKPFTITSNILSAYI